MVGNKYTVTFFARHHILLFSHHLLEQDINLQLLYFLLLYSPLLENCTRSKYILPRFSINLPNLSNKKTMLYFLSWSVTEYYLEITFGNLPRSNLLSQSVNVNYTNLNIQGYWPNAFVQMFCIVLQVHICTSITYIYVAVIIISGAL